MKGISVLIFLKNTENGLLLGFMDALKPIWHRLLIVGLA
jgi:hypothetical protein